METSSKSEVLAYMRLHRFAVVATIGADGGPQSSLVNIASTDSFDIVFDTLSTSRKHANLERDHRVAITFSGPDEQTLQLEGIAARVSAKGTADYAYREAYFAVWPDERERALLPEVAYWRITPRWARFSDYERGPLIVEFTWEEG
jgi:general stress protein 26